MKSVKIGRIPVGREFPPVLIAGPCVIESEDLLLRTCAEIQKKAAQYGFPYILKSSYEKANRTSGESFRGPGLEEGLSILLKAKDELGVPVLTDIHLPDQAIPVAEVADCLQIPAFLSRQTVLIEAAAATGKPINLKKAQFMAPEGVKHAVLKATGPNTGGIMITERGAMFGYGDLVVDMRSLVILAEIGCPVIFDATHSVQRPGGGLHTGGDRKFIQPLAQAAAATQAIDGIFLEVHPHPETALSDAASQLPLDKLDALLEGLRNIFDAVGRTA
ncbi:3-deoxy-8-phosphooctulonate synthase [bacterium]|nr:3-deoxy-8-phosphooctulonate synthase [bacterium]MBU1881053.1 3-deoxy-8-phosphooctulonate synthase [bacterium]